MPLMVLPDYLALVSRLGYQLKAGQFLIEFTVFGGYASLNPPDKLTLVLENCSVD